MNTNNSTDSEPRAGWLRRISSDQYSQLTDQQDALNDAADKPSLRMRVKLVSETNPVGKISINVHRLSYPKIGYEASTRFLKSELGRYFQSSGETEAEAINDLAHSIGVKMSALKVEFLG